MGADFEILQRGTSTLYGVCGGIWVMIMFAPPNKADMLLARPALAALARRSPGGFPTLTWILPEAGYRMDADTRNAAGEVTREQKHLMLAEATLMTGTGFQAAAVRAILTGIDAMSRTTCPKKVFSTILPAVAWCTDHLSAAPVISVVDVADAITAACPLLPA